MSINAAAIDGFIKLDSSMPCSSFLNELNEEFRRSILMSADYGLVCIVAIDEFVVLLNNSNVINVDHDAIVAKYR